MTLTMDEWGPWREHDGKGCPVPVGTAVRVERRSGEIDDGVAGCFADGRFVGPHGGGNSPESARIWFAMERAGEVIRYRIRRPKALQQLREIAENPPRVREVVG